MVKNKYLGLEDQSAEGYAALRCIGQILKDRVALIQAAEGLGPRWVETFTDPFSDSLLAGIVAVESVPDATLNHPLRQEVNAAKVLADRKSMGDGLWKMLRPMDEGERAGWEVTGARGFVFGFASLCRQGFARPMEGESGAPGTSAWRLWTAHGTGVADTRKVPERAGMSQPKTPVNDGVNAGVLDEVRAIVGSWIPYIARVDRAIQYLQDLLENPDILTPDGRCTERVLSTIGRMMKNAGVRDPDGRNGWIARILGEESDLEAGVHIVTSLQDVVCAWRALGCRGEEIMAQLHLVHALGLAVAGEDLRALARACKYVDWLCESGASIRRRGIRQMAASLTHDPQMAANRPDGDWSVTAVMGP